MMTMPGEMEEFCQAWVDAEDQVGRSEFQELADEFPYPEGSGRPYWSDNEEWIEDFSFGGRWRGVYAQSTFWIDGRRIGSIKSVRRGFLDTYYRTNDGKRFAHWGGPYGAAAYIKERFWLYGDPPLTLAERLSQIFLWLGL